MWLGLHVEIDIEGVGFTAGIGFCCRPFRRRKQIVELAEIHGPGFIHQVRIQIIACGGSGFGSRFFVHVQVERKIEIIVRCRTAAFVSSFNSAVGYVPVSIQIQSEIEIKTGDFFSCRVTDGDIIIC